MFTVSEDDRRVARQQAAVDRLDRRGTRPFSGRQRHVSYVWAELKATLPRGCRTSAAFRQEVMRRHAQLYADLRPSETAMFDMEARLASEKRDREVAEERAHRAAAVRLSRERAAAEKEAAGVTTHSSELRLSADDLQLLADLFASAAFSPQEVRKLRALAAVAPEPPPADVQAAFEGCRISLSPAAVRGAPEWLPAVCDQRSDLVGAIFQKSISEGGSAFTLLFATQNPQYARFLRLRPLERILPSLHAMTPADVLEQPARPRHGDGEPLGGACQPEAAWEGVGGIPRDAKALRAPPLSRSPGSEPGVAAGRWAGTALRCFCPSGWQAAPSGSLGRARLVAGELVQVARALLHVRVR